MRIFATLSLASLLLFQSLTPGMDWCCELPKVDNLVEHYQELSKNSSVSVTDFIVSHYGNENTDHQDSHDGELPFQGNHSCCHVHVFIGYLNFTYPEYHSFGTKFIPVYYRYVDSSGISFPIFQPPKLA